MAEPITREFMEHLVESQIHIHEEALDETIADNLRAIVERTLNGWRALRSLLLEPAWMGAVLPDEEYHQCSRCRSVTVIQKGHPLPEHCFKCGSKMEKPDRQSITTVEQSSSPKKCPSCGFVEPDRQDVQRKCKRCDLLFTLGTCPYCGFAPSTITDTSLTEGSQDAPGESAEDGKGEDVVESLAANIHVLLIDTLGHRLQKQKGAETARPDDATHGDATHSVTREWVEAVGTELDEHMAGGWMAVHKVEKIVKELGFEITELGAEVKDAPHTD